jgi:phosphatidylinositol alpha-1,6-mannosyltransferase
MTRQQDSDRPRALLVTRNLPPLLGGMERLNLHLARELAEDYRLTVIGPTGCRAFLPAEIDVIEFPARPLGRFLWKSLTAAWRAAGDKPRFVVAGSGLTAPMAKLAALRGGGKAIAYVHGLDLVARHPIYRMLWRPFLRKLDHAWANSASTADIAARIGVAKRRISVLHPGVSLPDDDPDATARARAGFGLEDAKVLLSVGRLTLRKGLVPFIGNALPEIERRHPGTVFLIVGEEAGDAIDARGAGVREAIISTAAETGMQDVVRLVPHCSDALLAGIYQAADVHVFPVVAVEGDIEGFGMVALEAAAHGTPTVAFATGGVPDAVAHGTSGRLVSPGDYAAFAEEVCRLLEGPDGSLRAGARRFAGRFEWSLFGDKLRRGLAELREGGAHAGNREGHAILDLPSRTFKARKIEAVLGLEPGKTPLRILEIGVGSGGIAHYFGTHRSLRCEVDAVDVQDSRQVFEGYRFHKVEGVELPFEDASFDVVISNHVIEHVGEAPLQEQHLAEMRRVLSPTGQGYLAVPNRWMLTEPHYRLAFLSWLPRSLRSGYLKWRRGVEFYDCQPLEAGEAERLFRRAGLRFERATGRALKATIALERTHRPLLQWLVERIPETAIDRLAAIVPTLVYRFGRDEQKHAGMVQ